MELGRWRRRKEGTDKTRIGKTEERKKTGMRTEDRGTRRQSCGGIRRVKDTVESGVERVMDSGRVIDKERERES
jgi:hypothetical protein